MPLDISNLVQACEWFPSHFLVISENVFSPLLYYSYLGAAIPSIFIGLYVYLSNRKELLNKLLFLTVVSFVLWILGAMVTWATEIPKYTMFFWTLLVILEPFVYFFAFYFSYVFAFKKDFSILQKVIFSIPLLPTLILASTKLAILGYDLSNCDRAAHEGIVASYGYGIEILYVALIIFFCITAIRKSVLVEHKKEVKLLLIGVTAFLLSFSFGNIVEVFSENWYIGQYGLFGAPIFVGFLAYLIVKFKTFNIKLIGAQALVFALGFLVLAILFIRHIENVRIVVGFTLLFVIVLGYILIKSVKREVEQREKLEILTKELQAANEKLKELDELKSQFFSFAAHQVKAPMGIVKGFAQLIYDGSYGPVNDAVKEKSGRIVVAVNTLLDLVANLLDMRKIEEGKMNYEFQEVDLVPMTKDMVNEFKPLADTKKLELTIDIGVTSVKIKADVQKFKQVILNFIDNAVKYTPSGWVKVRVANDPKKQGNVLVEVSDSGLGISPELMPKLFQQFSRDKEAGKKILGTGLGLFIAKQIVKDHGGDAWAESEGEGKGSRFYVSVPLVK